MVKLIKQKFENLRSICSTADINQFYDIKERINTAE